MAWFGYRLKGQTCAFTQLGLQYVQPEKDRHFPA